MDATSQFEDIHHSKKARNLMKEFYIGDFANPEDKESWEEYIGRKKKEEEESMSVW